jgi:hypothetical protein
LIICVSVKSLFAEDVSKAVIYRFEYCMPPIGNTICVESAHICGKET